VGLRGDHGYTSAATSIVKTAFPVKDSSGKPNVVCPESFTGGGSGQITSFGGFVDWAFGHVTGAWDWLADKYNGLKKIVVDAVVDYTPFGLQCKAAAKLYGKASGDDNAASYCHKGAEIAVVAGMTALGVPPTLPSYNALVDAGVDQAVEIAAEKFTEETGLPCPEECKDAMRKGFGAAADNLKKPSAAQACVDPSIAHDHGREPLCLPLGVLSQPAPNAISTPPVVIASLTRTANDRDPNSLFTGKCKANADLGDFRNVFQGQSVFGPFGDMAVPTQAVAGRLYLNASTLLEESMPKGTTRQIALIFDHASKFEFPWTHQLWVKALSPPHDELGPFGPDWFRLYSGAAATVLLGVNCGTTSGPPPGGDDAEALLTSRQSRQAAAACAERRRTMTIPRPWIHRLYLYLVLAIVAALAQPVEGPRAAGNRVGTPAVPGNAAPAMKICRWSEEVAKGVWGNPTNIGQCATDQSYPIGGGCWCGKHGGVIALAPKYAPVTPVGH
jgi:hypothetical protein